MKPNAWTLCPYKRYPKKIFTIFPPWKNLKGSSVCNLEEDPSEPDHTGTLILDFQPL
jgi:hypothetical protein